MILFGTAADPPVVEPPPVIPPNASEHRHKDPVTGKVSTTVSGRHTHADLEARIKALEDYARAHP